MSQTYEKYFVPEPSRYPIFGSIALLLIASGAVMWLNKVGSGPWTLAIGFAVLIYMLFGWFGQVVRESEGGSYGKNVDASFRWSMGWFIFSEVMFFAAFFGALFYIRVLGLPWLADSDNSLLWPGFSAAWPSAGPLVEDPFTPMAAWGIPAINTLILLTSGATLTWAHWGMMKENRGQLKAGLFLTILLGAIFLSLQIYEYMHAYHEMNLKLTSGIYGSTFFMLTGFHGLHVTIGAIMLTVMLFRVIAGHFSKEHHFAFEATAWYWHFVDVVWLMLFVVVYWL
ncbi:cytochrome c oxidase subunit 3 [Cognatazoarcus halotolerans]|uniref:cytochrome c oxidase subunit 3 n=1 Tax=Cognatazoarcus halotolerans TaxID=2686016 RepID=UPI00135BBC03|nr:cytochrome c oxidase subunit 3 [Cognatazoarcus halotolerans]MBX3678808.1 cytochrome c oxidase subunit 3 [Rhodocyclaceae bacterium]MCB1900466.1 cytochrome c oxidase subunit 3 [Rhodocyclaceae bacterium]MCP5309864.1 cytochrome c oxidase subunit 3 [Zoogloeaceae bacterium]